VAIIWGIYITFQFPIIANIGNYSKRAWGGKGGSALPPSNCRIEAKLLIDLLWNKIIFKIIFAIMWQISGEFLFHTNSQLFSKLATSDAKHFQFYYAKLKM
jgi:hypothetical protein